ncbi:site-specific integrase [Enterococcus sp. 5H]|uniref:site-specific integrase n=1 Tax=Enterococcus sp. 5H TaxID=1229490 RepID=UPI0023039CDD|nr:site-specific integrase [Enterococcus sp. 5H]MDA9472095.1 Site-specific recombinase, prophage lsa1 integrase [Enterococcus sp. 5H]
MATIKKYTKKDGTLAYQFNAYLGVDPLTGKSKRTTRRGFKTQKEAKLALAQLQLEIESNGFSKQDFSLFKDVYELWYLQYINTVKATTAQRVKQYFEKQILPAFGGLKINKITSAYCQEIVNQWAIEYKRFYPIKSYTNKIFEFAIRQNLIKDNPLNRIITPKKQREIKNKDEQNFLDKTQLRDFLKQAEVNEPLKYYAAYYTLAFTGLRKSELLALTWNDVDFKNNTLNVNKSVSILNTGAYISTTKTTSSERLISIDVLTLNVLKKWKLEQKKELLTRGLRVKNNDVQLLFNGDKNEIMNNITLWKRLKNYTDFNITPHGFRHTHASLLFESGATIKQVQERLGHSDINTTLNIYTHVTKDAEKDVANRLMNYMDF